MGVWKKCSCEVNQAVRRISLRKEMARTFVVCTCVPRGLKPGLFWALSGTAEAMPFHEAGSF
jgi:hypothetical protein